MFIIENVEPLEEPLSSEGDILFDQSQKKKSRDKEKSIPLEFAGVVKPIQKERLGTAYPALHQLAHR